MSRLTRTESRAATRARLLDAAAAAFTRDGYAAASLDRIAEEAGFSKGAIYSNFAGKEDLFLAVMAEHGTRSLDTLLAALDRAANASAAIDAVAAWADAASRQGNWSLLVLDHARHAGASARPMLELMRAHWRRLGDRLAAFAPATNPEALGALVFEITYAPAMGLVETPTAGALIRLALSGPLGSPPDD